ncbi:MAG: flagellar assembly protein FliH [Succinivibrionaceae bacterium]|nr:flagellar assembly protein FliH [Succinivibrionaceae bacterium]
MSELPDLNALDPTKAKPFEFDLMDRTDVDKEATNALGYKRNWYEDSLKGEDGSQDSLSEEAKEEKEDNTPKITLEELEQIRKEAYEDGFKEGKEEGLKSGYEEGLIKGKADGFPIGKREGLEEGLKGGEAIKNQEAARFSRFANHLVKPIADFDEEIASELIFLASRLAKSFIKEELKVSQNFVESSIWEIMRLLPSANSKINIYLNPEDLEKVKEHVNLQDINLIPDGSLGFGDLRADVGVSSIDIRQEDRIDAFIADFLHSNANKTKVAAKNNGFSVDNTYDGVDLNANLEEPNLNPSQELNQESEASISNDVMNNAQESSNEVVDAQIIEDESISQSQNLTKENLEANDKTHEVSFSEGGLSMAPKKS